MTRLLLLILIIIGFIILVNTFLKRLVKSFINRVSSDSNKTQSVSEKNKSKVIYERDDVVVMKGEAPDNKEKK